MQKLNNCFPQLTKTKAQSIKKLIVKMLTNKFLTIKIHIILKNYNHCSHLKNSPKTL